MNPEEAHQHRKDTLSKAREHDAFFDERIKEAASAGDEFEREYQERSKRNAIRFNLKIARWNESYWQARVAKLGLAKRNGDHEITSQLGHLTPKQMADRARLLDSLKDFRYESSLVQILDLPVDLPESVFGEVGIQRLAEKTLTKEFIDLTHREIEDTDILMLKRVEEFARKFNISLEVWQGMALQFVKNLTKHGSLSLIQEVLKVFPFIDIDEIKNARKQIFYGELDGENEKETSNFSNFTASELETSRLVSPQELHGALTGKQAQLADSIAKMPMVYFELRSVLNGQVPMQSAFARANKEPYKHMAIYPVHTKSDAGQSKAKVCLYLGETQERNRLEFTFSQSHSAPFRREMGYGNYFYLGTNSFVLEKAEITNHPLHKYQPVSEGQKFFAYDLSNPNISQTDLSSEKISLQTFSGLVKEFVKPKCDLSKVFLSLSQYAEKLNLSRAETNNLSVAISEFAAYTYRTQESMVGDCLTIPNNFKTFCKLKFGIELDIARYGEFHPEWGSADGYAPYTFLHEVCVFENKVVIDWTVTQYTSHAQKPVPYIYEIGEEIKRFGPLYEVGYGKTPNDPYKGTVLPPGHEIVYDSY